MYVEDITEKEFEQLVTYVKCNYGIDLFEKKALITSRLNNYLNQNNFHSFSEYFNYVSSDKSGQAVNTLLNKLTTNHTFFMREKEHFDYFKNEVLPYLRNKQKENKDLRIWSAGCSTGEEPYTLAMCIADYFGEEKFFWDTKVLATDISTNVLEKASKGIYSNDSIESIPDIWKMNYFKGINTESSIVVNNIRNEVIFKKFNLMDSIFPFKKRFHVIFCRNVMIYFDSQTKKELVNKFYQFTEPGGYLFIGHSESIKFDDTKYKYIMPAVYRKD